MRPKCLALLGLLTMVGAPLSALVMVSLGGAAASLHWSAPQFIQADAQGNVFLVRGDTLQVYPLTKSHELGEPIRLGPAILSGPLLDAAMSPRGEWVLAVGADIHYFVDAQEKPVPALSWFPAAVGFVHGDPAVLVLPPRLVPSDEDREAPPVVLRAVHDTWSAEVREALHGAAADYNHERTFRAALALDSRDGHSYYLARQYAYRIEMRKLGRERPVGEVYLGKGEPLLNKKSAEDDTHRLLAQARAEGTDVTSGKASAFHGTTAILALAEGRSDGRLYVLAGAAISAERCSLDRIDWTTGSVERTTLNVPCNGRASMAAGRDGLYIAKYSGAEGRFFAPWAAVEAASWTPVKEAHFSP